MQHGVRATSQSGRWQLLLCFRARPHVVAEHATRPRERALQQIQMQVRAGTQLAGAFLPRGLRLARQRMDSTAENVVAEQQRAHREQSVHALQHNLSRPQPALEAGRRGEARTEDYAAQAHLSGRAVMDNHAHVHRPERLVFADPHHGGEGLSTQRPQGGPASESAYCSYPAACAQDWAPDFAATQPPCALGHAWYSPLYVLQAAP